MTHLIVQKVEKKHSNADLPEIKPGYTVKVHQKIKEGEKERIQIYEGLVIAVNHGYGASKTMTVRKIVEGIGVEKIFPINSPNIAKIEVTKIGKVRRSKLYYMRDISGKAARLKEILVSTGTEQSRADHAAVKAAKKAASEAADAADNAAAEQTSVEAKTEVVAETPTAENSEEAKS
jgi:large subunit ribosomal protein L19